MMTAVAFVAEHIMGFHRGFCYGTIGGGNANVDGCETWQYCDWCGAKIRNGNAGLCPNYPFPNFSLTELMRRLGEMGHSVIVFYDPLREVNRFTISFDGARVCDTDEPFLALCEYLAKGGMTVADDDIDQHRRLAEQLALVYPTTGMTYEAEEIVEAICAQPDPWRNRFLQLAQAASGNGNGRVPERNEVLAWLEQSSFLRQQVAALLLGWNGLRGLKPEPKREIVRS